MAHRIYLYNYDQKTNQSFDTYLGEWNYEIPLLLYPLIAEDIRVEGVEFFSNKEQGIVQLRYFSIYWPIPISYIITKPTTNLLTKCLSFWKHCLLTPLY